MSKHPYVFSKFGKLTHVSEAVVAGLTVMLLTPAVRAGTYSWNTTTGSWSVAANWNGAPPAGGPDAAGDLVTLSPTGTNIVTIFNTGESGDAVKTIGSLTLGTTTTLNAGTGNGSLDFDNGASNSVLIQTGGTNTIGADISINSAKPLDITNQNGTGGNTNRFFINGLISGNGGITINGPGQIVLSNASNSFTGGVTLNSGVLAATSASGSFLGTGTLTINGGTLTSGSSAAGTWTANNVQAWNGDFGTTGTFALNTGTGAVTINANRIITANSTGVFTVGGAISDSGHAYTMTLAGSAGGRFAFAGANTYTGTTTINSGITLLLGGGTTSGSLSLSSAIVDNGTLAFNHSNTVAQGTDFATVISGSGGVSQVGAGSTAVLNGANTFTGTTAVSAGTLSVGSINSVIGGTSSSNLGAPTTVANGTIALGNSTTTGTLNYTGNGETTDRVINLAGTTGGGVITQAGAGLLKFASALTATGRRQ